MTFGSRVDTDTSSYFTNLTGFWRGDAVFYNLTHLQPNASAPLPVWHHLADELVGRANLTNATELAERVGKWNWTRSNKVAISFGDRIVWDVGEGKNVSKDIAMIHVRLVSLHALSEREKADRERRRLEEGQKNENETDVPTCTCSFYMVFS